MRRAHTRTGRDARTGWTGDVVEIAVGLMAWIIKKEYGPLLQERTAVNTVIAAGLMGLTALFVPGNPTTRLVMISAGVALYAATLILRREITIRDIAPLIGRR